MRFPIFVDLRGRRVVVIGGGRVGSRRAAVLFDFGAEVTVVSPALYDESLKNKVKYIKRGFKDSDLEGVFLAVAAANDRELNGKISALCHEKGIFVSVADRSEEGSFFFPAICKENGLCAGVVSEGDDHTAVKRAAMRIRGVL